MFTLKPSIIYLTYRPGSYDMLADSLKGQTIQDYELIIIDDYTLDRRSLVRDYLERQGIHPSYVGPSKPKCFPELAYNFINAMNTGILLSTGDPIILLQDYTWLSPDSIARFLSYGELYRQNYCITAVGQMWDDRRERNLEGLLSIWPAPWQGRPEDNDCTKSFLWAPEKFELFYAAIPYSLLVQTNGFPECYDAEAANQIVPFVNRAELFGAKFQVDRENIAQLVNHRNWQPRGLWHLGSKPPTGSTRLVERENCFDLKSHVRGQAYWVPESNLGNCPSQVKGNTAPSMKVTLTGKVIELGGGNNPHFHPNVDIREGPGVDIVANLEEPLPIEDESYDSVFSMYALEHLSWRRVRVFLAEVRRILKDGGRAVFITANLKEQAKLIASKDRWGGDFESCLIFGDQDYPENTHRVGFSPEYAERLFSEIGFQAKVEPHPSCPTDMVITAVKMPLDRFTWVRNEVAKLTKDKPDAEIVDIGCYSCPMTYEMKNCIWVDIFGYEEIAEAMKREGKTPIPPEKFVQATADDLPFDNKRFEAAICSELLEHVENPAKVLKEIKRVARYVLITVPNEYSWSLDHKPFQNTGHIRHYTEIMLKEHLKEAKIKNYSLSKLDYQGWAYFTVVADLGEVSTVKKKPKLTLKNIFEDPKYWCGELGYRPGADGIGYRDFPIHQVKVDYILSKKLVGKALDIGCAYGYIPKRLRDKGIDAYGIDLSQYALEQAPSEIKPYLKLGSADNLPFSDKEFDIVFSASVFEHLPPEIVPKAVSEAIRVAKRGIIAVTPGDDPHFDEDITHRTKQPLSWWQSQFPPEFEVRSDADEDWLGRKESKLNIGSFTVMLPPPEWLNLDIIDLSQYAKEKGFNFKQVDITKGLPFENDTMEFINCSHTIEHLTTDEGLAFLKECHRILRAGGVIRIGTPDVSRLAEAYKAGKMDAFKNIQPEEYSKAPSEADKFWRLLTAGHKTCYDFPAIRHSLDLAGFREIQQAEYNKELDTFPEVSLYTEAKKTTAPVARLDSNKLKIALLSTPFIRVPPRNYGGLELIVRDLAYSLARQGHQVTVFAPDDSYVEGCEMVFFGPALEKVHVDWLKAETDVINKVSSRLMNDGYDIICGHDWFGMEYSLKAQRPELKVCHVHHGGLNMDWWGTSKPPWPLNLISISKWMQKVYQSQGFASRVVYNGISIGDYPFKAEKGDRLLFVGRLDSFKRPLVAIEVAKKTGLGLDIVGGSFVADVAYMEQVKQACDGEQIKLYLDAPHEKKVELYQNARAVIFPSKMGEPFGLIVPEANATGTSIICTPDGAIPETVEDGVTGFICHTIDDMIKAVGKVDKIKPEDCRARVERLFTREIMAKNYSEAYSDILEGKQW